MNHWVIEFQKKLDGIYDSREAKNIAHWALQHVCDCTTTDILLGRCDHLNEEQIREIENILERLCQGEPIQHIFGEGEFHGYSFKVNGDVLIPRPETAELVDLIADDYQGKEASFLDIGTGSGCIAITLKRTIERLTAHAMDISPQALNVAKENAERLNAEVDFILDDILHPETSLKELDFIVSNPPYITEEEKAEMSANVLNHEPHLALFVNHENPLLFYEAIADFSLNRLKEEGALYFEINEHFGKETSEMLSRKGFDEIIIRKDLQGKERMIRCKKRRKR